MGFKIIAIDGPSGVGKSTISRLIADRIKFFYVDTGAMFRCLALNWEREGSPENEDSLKKLGDQTKIILENEKVICNGTDVTHLIRTELISKQASRISCFPIIREVMKNQQREMVKKVRDSKNFQGAVLEGRDIGTVVFPRADFKFYLEASPEVRAKRRMLQMSDLGENSDFKEILGALENRDFQDQNRKIAPLRPAEDATIINTNKLTVSKVLDHMLSYIIYDDKTL